MDQFHQQLLVPSTYPEATRSVAFRETHISRIYLTDNHAYKFKKPLNLDFLDFSSLEKRRHFCHEEVRLNRRFTTDTYLGVVELRQQNGEVRFSDHGKLIDYAVLMRRLPENLMLDQLIDAEAENLADEIPRLAKTLNAAMERAETCRQETLSNAEEVKRNCEENFIQTISAIGTSLTKEAHMLMKKVTARDLVMLEELMLERQENGFVRDGHGDLHTANICMTDPVCIYDCIEFNRRFRVADIVADLAFLIMDLEFRGRKDLADKLVAYYQEYSKDHGCRPLLSFYKQYRAWVRGKVNAILADDPQAMTDTRTEANTLAQCYFNLALGYLLKPTLFLTSGLMGVGKTTLARALSQATGAKHLRSDVLRKKIAGIPQGQACLDKFNKGIYSSEMTKRTYEELFKATTEVIARRGSIVVDASFSQEDERNRFMRLAERFDCPVWLIHLDCPEEVILKRLDQRKGDASDGRAELFTQQKASFSQTLSTNRVLKVDTSLSVGYNIQSLLCRALSDQEHLA